MSLRTEKIESTVHHEVAKALAELLPHSLLVTVTGVEVSPDLKKATVWISVLDQDESEVMAEIENVRRDVQKMVNKRLTTKFVPRLSFKSDHGGAYADRINRVLKNL